MSAPALHFCRPLDTVGDGTGSYEATADYLLSPKEFKIVADPNHNFELFSATVVIVTSATMSRFGYGAGTGLPVGMIVSVEHKPTGGAYSPDFYLHENNINFHHDWNRVCGADAHSDGDRIFANPAAVPAMFFTMDFVKLFGQPIVLRGDRAGKFQVVHADNYSSGGVALLSHHVLVRGKMARIA